MILHTALVCLATAILVTGCRKGGDSPDESSFSIDAFVLDVSEI